MTDGTDINTRINAVNNTKTVFDTAVRSIADSAKKISEALTGGVKKPLDSTGVAVEVASDNFKKKLGREGALGVVEVLTEAATKVGGALGIALSVERVLDFGVEGYKAFASVKEGAHALAAELHATPEEIKHIGETLEELVPISKRSVEQMQRDLLEFGKTVKGLTVDEITKAEEEIQRTARATGGDPSVIGRAVISGLANKTFEKTQIKEILDVWAATFGHHIDQALVMMNRTAPTFATAGFKGIENEKQRAALAGALAPQFGSQREAVTAIDAQVERIKKERGDLRIAAAQGRITIIQFFESWVKGRQLDQKTSEQISNDLSKDPGEAKFAHGYLAARGGGDIEQALQNQEKHAPDYTDKYIEDIAAEQQKIDKVSSLWEKSLLATGKGISDISEYFKSETGEFTLPPYLQGDTHSSPSDTRQMQRDRRGETDLKDAASKGSEKGVKDAIKELSSESKSKASGPSKGPSITVPVPVPATPPSKGFWGAATAPDKRFLPHSTAPDLPKYAKGGITSGPTIVGEAGPEVVIPLTGSHALGDKASGRADPIFTDDQIISAITGLRGSAPDFDSLLGNMNLTRDVTGVNKGRASDVWGKLSKQRSDTAAKWGDTAIDKIFPGIRTPQMPMMAEGGVTSGPSIAGEAGPEFVAPLYGHASLPMRYGGPLPNTPEQDYDPGTHRTGSSNLSPQALNEFRALHRDGSPPTGVSDHDFALQQQPSQTKDVVTGDFSRHEVKSQPYDYHLHKQQPGWLAPVPESHETTVPSDRYDQDRPFRPPLGSLPTRQRFNDKEVGGGGSSGGYTGTTYPAGAGAADPHVERARPMKVSVQSPPAAHVQKMYDSQHSRYSTQQESRKGRTASVSNIGFA